MALRPRTAAAALLAAATLLLSAAPTDAATGPVYSGKGWKAFTSAGVYSINPDPYVIVFANATARAKLAGYFKGPAAQITSVTGVKVTVSTALDTTPTTKCPPRHRIIVHYTYRPTGESGISQGDPCYQINDRSAWGGHIMMDNEYWTHTAWFSSNATVNDWFRKNVTAHELGHILGLAHPNQDLNRDGKIENGECVKNTAGAKPIMCSKNRTYIKAMTGGKYVTEFDVAGLKQMARNWHLRQT